MSGGLLKHSPLVTTNTAGLVSTSNQNKEEKPQQKEGWITTWTLEDGETRCNKVMKEEKEVVLQNLLMCMVCFYSLYYIAVSLCIGLLRVHEINSLLAPFDYTTQPSWQNPKYLVGVISTEVTYLLGGLVFAWIVEEWVWDYAITVTLLHIAMTVAVMSDFPSAEHWWIALGSGLVMMIFGGQLLAYKLFRSNFVYPAELQNF
ncbi:transmembrane protein 244 isoform X8 [Acanthopagrus latus]|uniref:transmembrane protein 244 isoform X8 n=1 Tax=Acanthopagrus latus TaxID=8177 RepID=UPI00187C7A43|nr:transmembrane protein 244 isoform X8 [Acanthopagrus latus]